MDDLEKIELYSEEVQEIMGRPPSKILRYGLLLIALIVAVVICLSFFMEYPDSVTFPATLIADNPPAYITGNSKGEIDSLLVRSGQFVREGEVVATLERKGNNGDILKIAEYMNALEAAFSEYPVILSEIPVLHTYDELGGMREPFLRFRKTLLKLSNKTGIVRNDEEYLLLEEAYAALKQKWRALEKVYLLKAPISGTIAYTKDWSQNAFFAKDETIFIVQPRHEPQFSAVMYLPDVNSGNIKKGLRVLIRVDGYPVQKYGSLEGRVASVNYLSGKKEKDSLYMIVVKLNKGLVTTYGENIPYAERIKGEGEVLGPDRSIAERMLGSMNRL